MNTVLYILAAIVLLGILIAVHEGGHFVTARLTRIPVREYAIGMGPKILSRTSRKTGIVYSLRAVPMGGFCAFYGEDDPDEKAQNDPRAFSRQKLWKRILTVVMGPGMNFILALAVLFAWYWIGGIEQITDYDVKIVSVAEDTPAAEAGFRPDDLVIAVDGETVTGEDTVIALTNRWKEGDGPIAYTVRRGDETLVLSAAPRYDEQSKHWLIGITMSRANIVTEHRTLTGGEAFTQAFEDCVLVGGAIFRAIGDLFRGRGWEDVAGPVGTLAIITGQVRDFGFDGFLNLLVIISVNLGVMNLLPIPGLDGARIIFMIVEAIRGRPVPPEKEAVVHLIGMAVLFGLMIFLTVKDVGRFF